MNRHQLLLALDSRKKEIEDYQAQMDLYDAMLTQLASEGAIVEWTQETMQFRSMTREQLISQNLSDAQIIEFSRTQTRDRLRREKLACQIEHKKASLFHAAQAAVAGTITADEQAVVSGGYMNLAIRKLDRLIAAGTITAYTIDSANTREVGGALVLKVTVTLPNATTKVRVAIVDSDGIKVLDAT